MIPDVTGATLRKAIAEQVDLAATTLYTDEGAGYRVVAPELAAHHTVNHAASEYVRYEGEHVITGNHAENFFSQLSVRWTARSTASAASTFTATWPSSTTATALGR